MDYNQTNKEQLDLLLNKYWEGETTVAEERIIKQFFQSNQKLPPQYESIRPHFDFVSTTSQAKVSDDFDAKFLEKLAQEEQKINKPKGKVIAFNYQRFTSIAATLLLMLGVSWYMFGPVRPNKPAIKEEVLMTIEKNGKTIEITDPEKALELTQAAFSAINRGMNEGNSSLKYIKQFNKTEIIK